MVRQGNRKWKKITNTSGKISSGAVPDPRTTPLVVRPTERIPILPPGYDQGGCSLLRGAEEKCSVTGNHRYAECIRLRTRIGRQHRCAGVP